MLRRALSVGVLGLAGCSLTSSLDDLKTNVAPPADAASGGSGGGSAGVSGGGGFGGAASGGAAGASGSGGAAGSGGATGGSGGATGGSGGATGGSGGATGGSGGGCVATTCASLNRGCGSASDGCGATLNCGKCTGQNSCVLESGSYDCKPVYTAVCGACPAGYDSAATLPDESCGGKCPAANIRSMCVRSGVQKLAYCGTGSCPVGMHVGATVFNCAAESTCVVCVAD